MTKKAIKTNVSKKDWLLAALDALEIGGIDAVMIERLASSLHISKSGFYWHFKGRAELLEEMLTFWKEDYTMDVISELIQQDSEPAAMLYKIAQMVWTYDLAKYDLAIRTWAKNDPLARRAVKRVTKQRMDFVGSQFSKLGFRGYELEMRTRLFVCYQTFERPMHSDLKQKEWLELAKRRIKLMTQK